MHRYILTGAPGCGKTSIIRALEIQGYFVIDEAATDIIAYEQLMECSEPWKNPSFIDGITNLQKQRQVQVGGCKDSYQFFDRSPICTYALCIFLGFDPSLSLKEEIKRMQDHKIYESTVFFIENLGFIENTDARQISFEEALRFENIHKEAYALFGYECVKIPKSNLIDRVKKILKLVSED
jgi:predicted ATPase